MCRTEPHSRAVRGSHPPRTAAPRRSDPQRRAAGGGAHTERSPTNGGAAPPRYGTARKVQREQRRALCRGGGVQSGSERGRRSAAGTSDTERNRGAAPPGPAGRGVRRHDGVRRPNPRGSDGRRGRSGRRAARPAPPIPALCARPPRAAPRASPAAAPRRSRRAAHGTGSGGGDGRRAAGTAGGQRPERPEPRPERTLTKSSMTGSLSPSFSPLTGTDSAMLQPSPPLASPAAATAVGTEPPPFASPAPRDCGPPRPAPQRTAPRGREWGAGPEARAWSDWRRSQKGGGDNGVGARLNSGAVGAEVGGANVGVGGDKEEEGVANAEVGGASALWAVPVGDVGGAKGAGRGQRSGRLGGRGRLSSSLGTAPCAPPGGGSALRAARNGRCEGRGAELQPGLCRAIEAKG